MDLTIPTGNTTLNVRVAVLAKTNKGYIFEKSPDGFYFAVGGRVKAGESSKEALEREVEEEIGLKIRNTKLVAIIENFFTHKEVNVQEICFVYKGENEFETKLPKNFIEIKEQDLANKDIKPEIIKNIIRNLASETSQHYIVSNI